MLKKREKGARTRSHLVSQVSDHFFGAANCSTLRAAIIKAANDSPLLISDFSREMFFFSICSRNS
jgi:hypothetical protein